MNVKDSVLFYQFSCAGYLACYFGETLKIQQKEEGNMETIVASHTRWHVSTRKATGTTEGEGLIFFLTWINFLGFQLRWKEYGFYYLKVIKRVYSHGCIEWYNK